MKSTSFMSTNAQTRVNKVKSTCTELSHKYVPLRGDAKLTKMWNDLEKLQAEMNDEMD